MCEVLPTLDETSPSPDGENSKLELLMMSMLEERDKLMEKLRENQESYSEATRKLSEVQADNSVLMRQLQALMPEEEERLHSLLDKLRSNGGILDGRQEDIKRWPIAKRFAQVARDLAATKEKLSEKEEEVQELKSERNNTRLLLEHLECLVARHERSLRMTVVKRQTSSTGVSSEVEVLKALKSLFDHHKALDEKVRERLRAAQERNMLLEDELMLAQQEIKTLQEGNKRMKRLQRNSVRLSVCYDNVNFTKEQLALLEDRDQTISDLQFSLDERDAQLEEAMHMCDDLADKAQEVEDELEMAVKELQREQAAHKITNKQLSELITSRSKLEARLSELQSQLTKTRHEVASLEDHNQQLSNQMSSQEAKMLKVEEDSASLHVELKQKELALQQAKTKTEEQLKKQTEQLTQAELRHGSAESEKAELQSKIDSLQQELIVAQEKERVNEGHISRLQSTIDRMLKESNDRLKTHLSERKQLSDERSSNQEKQDRLSKDLESTREQNQNLHNEIEQLRDELRQVSIRSASTNKPRPELRYSWQVTDLDKAIAAQNKTKQEEKKVESSKDEKSARLPLSPIGEAPEGEEEGEGEGERGWDLGEPEAVSKLVSMLEGQVSKLDKQLESMGGSMEEANEFDRMMQSVSETTFNHSAALETLPLSSPPGSRGGGGNKKYRPEALPSAIYRVVRQTDSPEPSPPASSSSSDSFTTGGTKPKPLKHKSSFSKLFRRKGSNHKKNSARRSSAPVPRSVPRVSDSAFLRESVDFSDLLESSVEREEDRKRKSEQLQEVLGQGTPFSFWDSPTVIAWLEVWVGVPYWFIAAIRMCLQNGAMLAGLADTELEQELGITNTLHRLKLRLAVQEIVSITSNPKLHRTTSPYGEMSYEWIGDYWLSTLGLPQYKEIFKACLVDARMLEHLTKKDLRTALKMLDTAHRNSLQYGITVLKKLNYNRTELEQRRENVSVEMHQDVLIWTSAHVIAWVESIGLGEYVDHIRECGVHGGVIALDSDFDHEKLALALQIPSSSPEVRKHLKTEFTNLLVEGTSRATSESQSHGKIVRKLSKKLKVSGRRVIPPNDFMAVRPSSPVLFSMHPSVSSPLHLPSLLEEPGSYLSPQNASIVLSDDTIAELNV